MRAGSERLSGLVVSVALLVASACNPPVSLGGNGGGGSGGDGPCAPGQAQASVICGIGACLNFIDAHDVCPVDGGPAAVCVPNQPAPQEICGDGIDNDCDGQIDEGVNGDCACQDGVPKPCYSGSPATRNVGLCHDGRQYCANSVWGQCLNYVLPSTEICDGRDNDCDGQIDEGCPCMDGVVQSCYGGPEKTLGVGACIAGTQTCAGGAWGECSNDVTPQIETCDPMFDRDCDGVPGNGTSCP